MINELRYIPIIHFLGILRKEGLDIGVNTHLHFFQILNEISPNTPPEKVKSFLAPLVAKNEEEQVLFYELFDQHAEIFFKIYFDPSYKSQEAVKNLVEEIKKEAQEFKAEPKFSEYQKIKKQQSFFQKSKNWALVVTALFLLTLVGLPIYQKFSEDKSGQISSFEDAENSLQEEADVTTEKPDLKENISIDEQILKYVKQPTETTFFQDTTRKLVFNPLEINNLNTLPNRIDNQLGYQIYQNQALLKYLVILGILLWFLIFQLKNFQRKKDLRKTDLNQNAPEAVELNIPKMQEIDFGNEFYNVVKKLNIRQETAHRKLDVEKTVVATVENGGQWNFQFARDDELVEYLFLIDQPNEQNHAAKLFDKVYQTLKENDLFVERFFFNGNPEKCWNEKYSEGIDLFDLQQHFKHHFLIILSNDNNLLSTENQDVIPVLESWEHRAILTSKDISDWGEEEAKLSEMFRLFPASLDGFTHLINSFEDLPTGNLNHWNFQKNTEREVVKINANNVLLKLNEHFPKALQSWIAACAVYPELNWDLTLRLGHILSEGQPKPLVTHGNLYRLSQLEWFQEGKIPDEIRSVLLIHPAFSIEQERKVRAEICRILENSECPENSPAEEKRKMLLAINYLHIDKNASEALEIYREAIQKEFQKDAVSIANLNKKAAVLTDWMPSRIKNLIFQDESPMLGTRLWVRFAGIFLLCLVVQGFSLKLNDFENKIKADGKIYSINSKENQHIFYGNFANYHFNEGLNFYNQNLFFKAGKQFERAIDYETFAHSSKNEKNVFFNSPDFLEALAVTYLYQNREEAVKIIEEKIRRGHPNYFQKNRRNLQLFSEYDFVDFEIENRILVQKNKKFGFLGEGKLVIPLEYDFVTNFNEGKALAIKDNQKMVIDFNGNTLENVTDISIFENTENELKGFLVNEKFSIIPAEYSEIADLKNGFYKVQKNEKFGFFDENLQTIIPANLDTAEDFNENGVVQVSKNGFDYFLNANNICVAECLNNSKKEEKLAANNFQTFYENGKYGFKDKNDNVKISPQFLEAWPFGKATSARVRVQKGWGLIDPKGQPISEFNYEQIEAFENGTYLAQKNGKKGFLNKDGEEISAFIYDFAMPFSDENLAVVRIGAKNGVINKSGVPVIEVVFDNINLLAGQAEVILGEEKRMISLK